MSETEKPAVTTKDKILVAAFWAWAVLLVVAPLAQLFHWKGVMGVFDVRRAASEVLGGGRGGSVRRLFGRARPAREVRTRSAPLGSARRVDRGGRRRLDGTRRPLARRRDSGDAFAREGARIPSRR